MFRDIEHCFGKIGSFTAYSELNGIYHKVVNRNDFVPFSEIIYAQNKFDLEKLYQDFPEIRKSIGSEGRERRLTTSIFSLPIFHNVRQKSSDFAILGLVNNKREWRFIEDRYVERHPNLHKYKIIVPKSNGTGAIGEVLSTPLIATPLIGITQSFISIGTFDDVDQATACLKYVKTKFTRTMLGILKVTQDNSKETWRYVPQQNFTINSDIDWSQPISRIDNQLFDKYGFSEEERLFVEEKVKPME